ncbi:MAG: PGPGW domain-containing protein [Gammaproteobacteria bacterium]|nr:PGPGW domain-containing protein [Gammaproteobacteria bacterium]NVK88884.1 PGPGW domain-containing protein [Gammaproteobacteria bacterium]
MRYVKKTLVTLVGILILLIGIVFIVLPGPAILIIPLGLALLATEYPIARKWLTVFQQKMRATAHWLDRKWRNRKRSY